MDKPEEMECTTGKNIAATAWQLMTQLIAADSVRMALINCRFHRPGKVLSKSKMDFCNWSIKWLRRIPSR